MKTSNYIQMHVYIMQGFETRSTSIANRIITLRNLKGEISQLQVLENYPGEKLSGKEWRRRRKRQSFPVLAHDSTNLGLSSFGIHTDEEKDGFEFNNRDLCTSSPRMSLFQIMLAVFHILCKLFKYFMTHD